MDTTDCRSAEFMANMGGTRPNTPTQGIAATRQVSLREVLECQELEVHGSSPELSTEGQGGASTSGQRPEAKDDSEVSSARPRSLSVSERLETSSAEGPNTSRNIPRAVSMFRLNDLPPSNSEASSDGGDASQWSVSDSFVLVNSHDPPGLPPLVPAQEPMDMGSETESDLPDHVEEEENGFFGEIEIFLDEDDVQTLDYDFEYEFDSDFDMVSDD